MIAYFLRLLAVLGCSVLLLGCADEPKPEFGTVSGVVKRGGKALPKINVQFFPDPSKGNSWPISASGLTDDQGRYALTYGWRLGEGAGAPVGWHRVILDDTILAGIPQDQPLPPKRVPENYCNPGQTPLSFEVKPGNQTIDIEVRK